jgi:hypothetical protein
MNTDAKTEIKGKERYKAGVLKYAQMGYWDGDYEPKDTDLIACSGSRRRRASIRSRPPPPWPAKARRRPGPWSGPTG